jgi:thiol:disulfide interchange protein
MPKFLRPNLTIFLAILLACLAIPTQAIDRNIYPAVEQAKSDLAAGLRKAAATHKHVILDFGGDWCGDCQVLDLYFHDPVNKPLLEANYVLVHINVGHLDQNKALSDRYQVPVAQGVPALAVLDEHGRLLYGQRSGEFKRMRTMESISVTSFLLQWKPAR